MENGTFDPVGLDENIAHMLADTDKLLQKINRFVEPDIISLSIKVFSKKGEDFTIILIPESIGVTHMVSKDGVYTFPSGEKKVILKKGTFYIRRSGGNHLGDPRDFEDIVKKRLEFFKGSILGKIARVVEAPQNSRFLWFPRIQKVVVNINSVLTMLLILYPSEECLLLYPLKPLNRR